MLRFLSGLDDGLMWNVFLFIASGWHVFFGVNGWIVFLSGASGYLLLDGIFLFALRINTPGIHLCFCFCFGRVALLLWSCFLACFYLIFLIYLDFRS